MLGCVRVCVYVCECGCVGGGGVKNTKVKCIYRPQSIRNEICLRDFNTLANVLSVCECQCCVRLPLCVCVCECACRADSDWQANTKSQWIRLAIEKLIQLLSLASISARRRKKTLHAAHSSCVFILYTWARQWLVCVCVWVWVCCGCMRLCVSVLFTY